MNCVIRADASVTMGTGHVMRCLTLADMLRARGARVSFICRTLPGHLCDLVEERSYRVFRLPAVEEDTRTRRGPGGPADPSREHAEINWMVDAVRTMEVLRGEAADADWLVVDHHALDRRWEALLKPFVRRLMVIDDLADRAHLCDLLLDPGLSANMAWRFDALVPPHCRKLVGPRYALLRPEFREARSRLDGRNGAVRRILVFFGGSDPSCETAKALEAIRTVDLPDVAVDVVVGPANPHRDRIRSLCAALPGVRFHVRTGGMARLAAEADLAMGSGGGALWERCFLGLPTIAVATARGHTEAIEAAAAAGAAWNLGWRAGVGPADLADAVARARRAPATLKDMGRAALRVMDGAEKDEAVVTDALMGVAGVRV
jgi:UDP-2,4-diacetamido-2,4,6-trideoxy-beta-L-altropyranose hydrolase